MEYDWEEWEENYTFIPEQIKHIIKRIHLQ